MIPHKLESNNLPLILEPNDLYQLFNLDYVKLERLLTIKNEVSPKEFSYRSYKLKKKGAGYRQIVAPKKDLKRVQNIIFTKILALVEPSEFAHGFRKEYSIVSNARVHLNSEIIYNIDLKNFFTSIKFDKVQEVFQRLGYSESVSLLLARLCTIAPRYYSKSKNMWILNKDKLPYLPQGASTSPILSNLVCIESDKGLNKIAKKFNFRFTRYADDLTFSSKMHKKIPKDFQNEVFRYIRKEGFKVNWKKERFSRKFKKREVTGIIVHKDELSLPRAWIRNLRAALYQLRYQYSRLKFAGADELLKNIEGRCSYATMVNKEKYSHFYSEFRYLNNFKFKNKP